MGQWSEGLRSTRPRAEKEREEKVFHLQLISGWQQNLLRRFLEARRNVWSTAEVEMLEFPWQAVEEDIKRLKEVDLLAQAQHTQ